MEINIKKATSKRSPNEDGEDDDDGYNLNTSVSTLINLFEKSKSESSLIDKIKPSDNVSNSNQKRNSLKKVMDQNGKLRNNVKNIQTETKKPDENKQVQSNIEKFLKKNSRSNKKKTAMNCSNDNSDNTLDRIFLENQTLRQKMKSSKKKKPKTHTDLREDNIRYQPRIHKTETELNRGNQQTHNGIKHHSARSNDEANSEVTDCTDTTIEDILNSNRQFGERYKSNLEYFINDSDDDLIINHFKGPPLNLFER